MRTDNRVIDTSNKELKDFNPNNIRLEPKLQDQYLLGFPKPSRYGIIWSDQYQNQSVEIHRNGLVHYVYDYGSFDESSGKKTIWEYGIACNLLQAIQFADRVYSTSDFLGKVRIVLKVTNSMNSEIIKGNIFTHFNICNKCDAEEIYIEREWDSWRLKEDYLEIGKSIMDEFSNYYGLWKSINLMKGMGLSSFPIRNESYYQIFLFLHKQLLHSNPIKAQNLGLQ